jgi:hypothetical protein
MADLEDELVRLKGLHSTLQQYVSQMEGVGRYWGDSRSIAGVEQSVREIDQSLDDFHRSGAALLPEKLVEMLGALGGPVEGFASVSKAEVSKHIALLIGSFPTSNVPEPKVFTTMMVEDVTAAKPSWLALYLGCRSVRRHNRFMPAIAEVLSAIERKEWELQQYISDAYRALSVARSLPDRKKQLIKRAEELKRIKEAKKDRIRKLVLEGDFLLRGQPQDLIDEVKADLKREGIERPLAPWERPWKQAGE